ncbi:hypothetical protein SMICM17S_05875 [Streptomyces microflavus]
MDDRAGNCCEISFFWAVAPSVGSRVVRTPICLRSYWMDSAMAVSPGNAMCSRGSSSLLCPADLSSSRALPGLWV